MIPNGRTLRLSEDYRKSALKLLMDFVSWKHSSLHYLTIIYNTVQDIILKLLSYVEWNAILQYIKLRLLNCFRFPLWIGFFVTFGVCCINMTNTILGCTTVPKDIGTLTCSSYQNYVNHLKGTYSQIVMLKRIYNKFVNIKITYLLKSCYEL